MRCFIFISLFKRIFGTGYSPHWLRETAPDNWDLPLIGAGTLRWNARGVPYAEADNLHDAAVLTGAACYLLRANQIQLFRHVAWGRLAELGGPAFIRIDVMIRSLDMHCAQKEILAQMPMQTRLWIEAFCKGLNAVAAVTPRNREARLLGIHHRPFDVCDVLAIGRLTGTDVNWPLLFDLFQVSHEGGLSLTWRRLLTAGGLITGFGSAGLRANGFWLLRANRSGSNCMAFDGRRTVNGKPFLASDPHLNHQLPNLWLLIGIRCPQMHAVGLMFPGVPVIGLGRNPQVAWGGTNLRSYSSDLVLLTERDVKVLRHEEVKIRVRGWRTVRRVLRHSSHGPVVSDHLAGKRMVSQQPLALKWAGHWPSDEISAFMGLMQLRSANGLQNCMKTYAVTGLNVLAADVHGNIAQTHAAWLPVRDGFQDSHYVIQADDAVRAWAQRLTSEDLPFRLNPAEGFLLSTNQDPRADVPISWFFNGEERNARLRELVAGTSRIDHTAIMRWQCDVRSAEAFGLSQNLVPALARVASKRAHLEMLDLLARWDGAYDAESAAAAVFESVLSGLRDGLVKELPDIPAWWIVQEWAFICHFLLTDVQALPLSTRQRILRRALDRACRLMRRGKVWGDIHRLAPRHVLSFLPWVGKRWFPSIDFPAAGSRETLMKNAHGWVRGRAASTYGAQARQRCDLSHPDENWFVLLGGQDEDVRSPHATDQAGLWVEGLSIRMPLSESGVRRDFPRVWHFKGGEVAGT